MKEFSSAGVQKNEKDKIEALASQAALGDKFAFVELTGVFSPYITSLARSFCLPESEFDDLCQTGRIALYKAVGSYDMSRAAFTTFAKVCIKNALTSFVRSYAADSKFIRETLSLEDAENAPEMAEDTHLSPENVLLADEFLKEVESVMDKVLSESERKVLGHKLSGIGIAEISVMMGKDTKSVENTLFRARKKLRAALVTDVSK